MYVYAQTNIQLFNQLRDRGYSNAELQEIFNAYQLTIELFTGQFRASGKTFIAHLVGTASILTHLRVSSKLIAAGLLHAAYSQGDFGGIGKPEISQAKRKRVRDKVGKEIEEYIARYTALKWDENTIIEIHQGIDRFSNSDVLLIRLANELEEYLDFGIIYCGDSKQQQYSNHQNNLIVEIAEKLGYPTLAVELANAFRETTTAQIPPELCNPTEHYRSALIPPNSYQRKLPVWFDQTIGNKIAYWHSLFKSDFLPP
ncbi:HD domain-containing protein [Candidatus Gracilibacteria bacterium]|nr:HD domain-containing protein [Candidatus Gracilibacteria bacterium]